MVTLWIGDFRTKQLQNIYQEAQQTAEYHYLVEDLAEYSWFNINASSQLPTLSLERANVVIMLGLLDCVYSCISKSFIITDIANKYAETINKLVVDYPNFNFYVCSVAPVSGHYPFASQAGSDISQELLDKKINSFNSTLKTKCKATYVDSYDYLTSTYFDTIDGVRFTTDTCSILHNYISANFNSTITAAFSPRLTAPVLDPEVDTYLYWAPIKAGGENPFEPISKEAETTLPNCAAYAWGRFYEIIGEVPKLSIEAANKWYDYTPDGYKRGTSPKVGAIACWSKGSDGFVAVVEQVQANGNIITSESGWDKESTSIWRLIERENKDNWGMGTSYSFQGFIYCPQTINTSKDEICAKNSYDISIEEMKPNARYIWQYFGSRGWTLNAVAGLLGNLQVESKMSPIVWQRIIEGSIINADGTHTLNTAVLADKTPGYGLVQWTPYYKYTNWCTDNGLNYWDIDSQLQRIAWEIENKEQWQARPSKGYDLTFNQFIISTKNASWLAEAFAFCYERPGSSTGTIEEQNALRAERGTNGEFWYNYLSTLPLEVSSNKIKVSGFKIDKCSATQVSISFITSQSIDAKCTLLEKGSNANNTSAKVEPGYKVFTFKNLIPNTEYLVKLDISSDTGDSLTRELTFNTLQDYPQSVKNITLTIDDKVLLDNSNLFNLNIVKPTSLGYWKSNSGYDISLIVNNNIVKTLVVDNAAQDILWRAFNLAEKFGYKCKIGDNIQIGARVWVKTSAGQKLYCGPAFKASEPVCLLNKQLSLYLNK